MIRPLPLRCPHVLPAQVLLGGLVGHRGLRAVEHKGNKALRAAPLAAPHPGCSPDSSALLVTC